MTKEKPINQLWKILMLFTFIVSLFCLYLLIQPKLPKYEYETRLINLNDDNIIINENIVDYICDEGVAVSQSILIKNYFYASTWRGDNNVKPQYQGMNGKCFLKIKKRIR